MPARQAPAVTFALLHIPRLYAALCNPLRRFAASYHSTLTPTLIRGATKYHRSHSRNRIRLRWNCGMWPPVHGTGPPGPSPQLMFTRSKCVPTSTDPGVLDDPVKNPFG